MPDPQATTPEGIARRERARREQGVPTIAFIGGTGRSGTHVMARMLGRHPRFALIPVEVRFHVDEAGFPGLLSGRVTKKEFVRRLRGFWWKGFQTRRMRGLFRFVPEERFEKAVAAFEDRYDADPEAACAGLFTELLWFRVEESPSAYALVEQSCDTVARAPTLLRLFEEAKFVHVVRDGRDASASRVAQTHGLVHPRTRRQGLEWWEERIRRVDAGARAIPDDRLLTVSLDELLQLGHREALRPLCLFLGIYGRQQMWRFFRVRMSAERANSQRWLRGVSERRARELDGLYEDALDRLEADGVLCAPLLRRTLERSRAGGDDAPPLAYLAGDGRPLEVGT